MDIVHTFITFYSFQCEFHTAKVRLSFSFILSIPTLSSFGKVIFLCSFDNIEKMNLPFLLFDIVRKRFALSSNVSIHLMMYKYIDISQFHRVTVHSCLGYYLWKRIQLQGNKIKTHMYNTHSARILCCYECVYVCISLFYRWIGNPVVCLMYVYNILNNSFVMVWLNVCLIFVP